MKPSEEELDRLMQRKTPKEVANWVPWDELVKRRGELDQQIVANIVPKFQEKRSLTFQDKQLVLDHLILSLYTMTPGPLRNEYAECVFFFKEDGDHELTINPGDVNTCELNDDFDRCFFHLERHKTLERDGVRKLAIPELLMNVLLRSFNQLFHTNT
jgi:hypothetical protein